MNIPFTPGKIYHVYTHANGNENLFRVDDNYDYFLKKYQEYIQPVADTFAYCLMPNHFHFLIQVREENELKKFLIGKNQIQTPVDYTKVISLQWSHLLNGYSQAYNKMFERRGSLFQPRIRRKEIDQNNYLTTVLLYIHLNPVKHGFVEDAINWSYSSFQDYCTPDTTFLNKWEVIKWFGNTEQFLISHRSTIPSIDLES